MPKWDALGDEWSEADWQMHDRTFDGREGWPDVPSWNGRIIVRSPDEGRVSAELRIYIYIILLHL